MPEQRVSLTEGYQGAQQQNRGISDEGESVNGFSKAQHGHTMEFQGNNKGALATQAANGSTGTANSLSAAATMNNANAAGGSDYLRHTAQHEETGAHTQSGDSQTVESHADDLMSKINFTS